jgi:hypothetical protein
MFIDFDIKILFSGRTQVRMSKQFIGVINSKRLKAFKIKIIRNQLFEYTAHGYNVRFTFRSYLC